MKNHINYSTAKLQNIHVQARHLITKIKVQVDKNGTFSAKNPLLLNTLDKLKNTPHAGRHEQIITAKSAANIYFIKPCINKYPNFAKNSTKKIYEHNDAF